MYACMHACMYACMHACIKERMYALIVAILSYACMYMHVRIYLFLSKFLFVLCFACHAFERAFTCVIHV